jgi:hypothetical protein
MKFLKLLPLLLLLCAPVIPAQKRVEKVKVRDAKVEGGILVKQGEEVKVEGEDLRLTFVSVTDDSRCPEGATCVWAGNGRVHLVARNAKDECAEFDLNTTLAPVEHQFGKYIIRLARLSPHPSIKHVPQPDEYVATFVVTKNTKD